MWVLVKLILRLHDTTGCETGCLAYNRLDNRLHRVKGVL